MKMKTYSYKVPGKHLLSESSFRWTCLEYGIERFDSEHVAEFVENKLLFPESDPVKGLLFPFQQVFLAKYIISRSKDNLSNLQEDALNWKKFFHLFYNIEVLYYRAHADIAKELNVEKAQGHIANKLAAHGKIQREISFQPNEYSPQLEELLLDSKFDCDDLIWYRQAIASYGLFGSGIALFGRFKEYLKRLNPSVLEECEEPYRMVGIINWCLWCLGKPKFTVIDAVMSSYTPVCRYCGDPLPGRINARTCGKEECQKKRDNNLNRRRYVVNTRTSKKK